MPYCSQCGKTLVESDRFCPQCGTRRRAQSPLSQLIEAPQASDRPPPVDTDTPRAELVVAQHGSVLQLSREPLTPAARIEASTRWPLVVLGVLALAIAASGLAGYWWFSRQTPPTGSPPAAVEATDEIVSPTDQAHRDAERAGQRANPSAPDSTGASAGTESVSWRGLGEFTRDVKEADAALGLPDGRMAIIAPGGTIALAYGKADYFYNAPGADVRVYAPEGDRTPYVIFARSDPGGKWIRFDVNQRGFPKGEAAHDFGHHGLERVHEIMIRNDGTVNLYIDAVLPLHSAPESHSAHDQSSEHSK